MRIGVTGSWRQKDQESWNLRLDFRGFKDACFQIGAALAQRGVEITVGSDSIFTADKYVVEGYLSNFSDKLLVRVVRPQNGPAPFPKLYNQYPNTFVYLDGETSSWRHTRQQFISDIDALVTVGGADGTYQAGLELLRLTKKLLVPIGSFGGASSRLLKELLNSGTLRQANNYEKFNNPWTELLASHVIKVLDTKEILPDLSTLYDVFISYSSADSESARELVKKIELKNIKCFHAEASLEIGKKWMDSIHEAIKVSKVVIILLTPRSIDRPWVLIETGAAWVLSKPLIPALKFVEANKMADPLKEYQARIIETDSQMNNLVSELQVLIRQEET